MDLNDGKRAFAGLKSKLGFGGRKEEEDYEEYYDDYEEYDEGDDYGEMGFDEESYAPSSRYDRYNSVTTRDAGSRSTMPRLVSIEDVRARTQVPSLPKDDDYSSRRSGLGGSSSFRTMVDSSLPPTMTPEGSAAVSAAASASRAARSEGLNSLFESTTPAPASASSARPAASGSPFERLQPSRSVKVLRPMAYNDAEAVSTSLKLGEAVVLCLTGTPDALAKRILDFSFGVASALDANVECVGSKVFAITRIDELSDAERSYLHSQGVI